MKADHKGITCTYTDWCDEEGWTFEGDPSKRVFPLLSACKAAIDKMLQVKYHEVPCFRFGNGYREFTHPQYSPEQLRVNMFTATRPHSDPKEFWLRPKALDKKGKPQRPELTRPPIFLENAHNRALIPKIADAHARVIEAEKTLIELFSGLEMLTSMEAVK